MRWDPSLETGDDDVDSQHRTLLELFNALVRTETQDGAEAVRDALSGLTDYVNVHFSMEEELMRHSSLPSHAMEEHVAEHRALTARVREQVIAYRAGKLDSVVPVAEFLYEWLCDHVRKVDALLVSHIRTRPSSEGA